MAELALRDAFQNRKGRFRLLDIGIAHAQWQGKSLRILEIGCANGGAAAHLAEHESFDLISVDIDPEAVSKAAADHPNCCFACADACSLPFADASFDGLFSEAAFSVIPDKQRAAEEYVRVLRPGGRFLMNDFFLRNESENEGRNALGIPCADGVCTAKGYTEFFQEVAMRCVMQKEYYFDFLTIANSLSEIYSVDKNRIGCYIQKQFGSNAFVDDFFRQSGISYIQMIFEKEAI